MSDTREGELRFKVIDKISPAPVGCFGFVPGGPPDCTHTLSEKSTPYFQTFTPADRENQFEELAKQPDGILPAAGYRSIVEGASTTLVGAPLPLSDPLSGNGLSP
jgi:hypothetical protein